MVDEKVCVFSPGLPIYIISAVSSFSRTHWKKEICSGLREEKGNQVNTAPQPHNYHHQEKEETKKLNGGG